MLPLKRLALGALSLRCLMARIRLPLMLYFSVSHKAACQTLSKAFLNSMKAWWRFCWCWRYFSQRIHRLKICSVVLLPALKPASSSAMIFSTVASIYSVWSSAWLCLGDWWGWLPFLQWLTVVAFPCFTVVKSFTTWYALSLLFFLRFSSILLHCSPIQFSFAFSHASWWCCSLPCISQILQVQIVSFSVFSSCRTDQEFLQWPRFFFFLLTMFVKDLIGCFSHCCVEGGDHWIQVCVFIAHDGERCKLPAYHCLEDFQHIRIFELFKVKLESCVFWLADSFQEKVEGHHRQVVVTSNGCSWKKKKKRCPKPSCDCQISLVVCSVKWMGLWLPKRKNRALM